MSHPPLGDLCGELREWATSQPWPFAVEKLRLVVRARKDAHFFVQKLGSEIDLTAQEVAEFVAGQRWVELSGVLVSVEYRVDDEDT